MISKERTIEQSMRMFVAQGVKQVRMDDIAHQLGMSKRTLYELFSDKEELLDLAITCYFDQYRARSAKISQQATNSLEALFLVTNYYLKNSAAIIRLINELQQYYPRIHKKVIQHEQKLNRENLYKMLEDGMTQGLFLPSLDINLVITMLYYTTAAMTEHRQEILLKGISQHQIFLYLISNFLRGISTIRGIELIDKYLSDLKEEK